MNLLIQKTMKGQGWACHSQKRFVELHGGEIWVENEYGKGSRFMFTIPAPKDEEKQKLQLLEGKRSKEKKRLAVVADIDPNATQDCGGSPDFRRFIE